MTTHLIATQPFHSNVDRVSRELQYNFVNCDNTTSNKKRRQRRKNPVKQACNHCRDKHLACDEQRPCSQCTKRGVQCVFDSTEKEFHMYISPEEKKKKRGIKRVLPTSHTELEFQSHLKPSPSTKNFSKPYYSNTIIQNGYSMSNKHGDGVYGNGNNSDHVVDEFFASNSGIPRVGWGGEHCASPSKRIKLEKYNNYDNQRIYEPRTHFRLENQTQVQSQPSRRERQNFPQHEDDVQYKVLFDEYYCYYYDDDGYDDENDTNDENDDYDNEENCLPHNVPRDDDSVYYDCDYYNKQ